MSVPMDFIGDKRSYIVFCIVRLQHIGDRLSVADRLDGKVSIAVHTAFGGAVEDLPIDQPSASVKTDATRSDATQGKGDLLSVLALISHVVPLLM